MTTTTKKKKERKKIPRGEKRGWKAEKEMRGIDRILRKR